MTDKELLELAAKAAGVRHIEYTNDYDGRLGLQCCDEIGRHTLTWSPLTDDGDALRLAVKLGIQLMFNKPTVYANGLWENMDDDTCAATRRAIVRSAAEIGKTVAT